MPITDLPPAVPNPPARRARGPLISISLDGPAAGTPERPAATPTGTFRLELPPNAPAPTTAEVSLPSEAGAAEPAPPPAPRRDVVHAALARPLPSYAIAAIGGLALACLALCVALVAALSTPSDVAAPPPAVAAAVPVAAPAPETNGAPSPASFPTEPAPIPVDLLTQLEAASDQPLEAELSRLLEAVQHGFGTQSARLEPTLRSYVYRMAARFEWNPDTFRVAVTAPDARLAEARKALLEQLFPDAIAAGRLQVGAGTGPHALTLVSE